MGIEFSGSRLESVIVLRGVCTHIHTYIHTYIEVYLHTYIHTNCKSEMYVLQTILCVCAVFTVVSAQGSAGKVVFQDSKQDCRTIGLALYTYIHIIHLYIHHI